MDALVEVPKLNTQCGIHDSEMEFAGCKPQPQVLFSHQKGSPVFFFAEACLE